MIFLQTSHLNFSFLERANSIRAGQRGADGRHDRNFCRERGVANDHFVLARNFPAGRVDDEIDIAVLDTVEHVGTSLVNLEYLGHFDFCFGQRFRGSAGGNDFKTELQKFASNRNDRFFIGV